MVTPLILPAIITQPWALNGSKNTIPTLPDATPGHASLDLGFPPLTRTPIQSGGVPPSGLDFNGVFNLLSQHDVWVAAGGLYPFNSALATATGGYKKGAVLVDNAGDSTYISLVDNNTVDFNTTPATIGVNWAPYGGVAANTGVTTITTTGGTVTLTAAQAAAQIIRINGVLASASTIVFPSSNYTEWKLINLTTGAFSMVSKAATGQSLTMSQGFTNAVFYDGSQLVFPDHDGGLDSPAFRGNPTAPTPALGDDDTSIATTAFAMHMQSPAFTGTPTVPTAAPGTSTTQTASTAFVGAAVTAGIGAASITYVAASQTVTKGAWLADTTAGAITLTLPAAPALGDPVRLVDVFGTWGTNLLTVGRNGKNIQGLAEDLICNITGEDFMLIYNGTEWRLQ